MMINKAGDRSVKHCKFCNRILTKDREGNFCNKEHVRLWLLLPLGEARGLVSWQGDKK